MIESISRIRTAAAAAVLVTLPLGLSAQAASVDLQDERRQVDLVIALDVSGSMSQLIGSAKQRLWDIVNELGRATPQPQLRVAILSYGNPDYGAQTGYVRIDQPFTSDLDAISERLFAFGTNGGDEYVARVVYTSVESLQWSTPPDALRIIFVAGNEPANQDPKVSVDRTARAAADKDIVVNTIFCGSDVDPGSVGWRELAMLTNGMYASIDQGVAAVANFATPLDARLAELNLALNDTYVAFGPEGERARENQLTQDVNAALMSAPTAASRAVTKASGLYRRASWDLVDAMGSGTELEDIDEADLPDKLREMQPDERQSYMDEKIAKRNEIRSEITRIAVERRAIIEQMRRDTGDGSPPGLDEAVLEGLRQVAGRKGFKFDPS